ncbi:DMT family transporter [Peribacillus acanthi]|uniref:DMT family transporter n=1 Tax=Peribacillus acanthi TaxID=2171554 RepID=UPI000D3E7E8F|nr:DMT family transporter [Peribacillus acanthi]
MKRNEMMALLGLAALWGASFLFIRISSQVLGPFLTIQGRVTIAAIALIIYMFAVKKPLEWKLRWRQYLMIGLLNAVIPSIFIAVAALQLPASMSAILNSMTPLFTALVAWGWLGESMTFRKWLGIFTGTFGVALLVGWSSVPFTLNIIIACLISILSTVSYGFAGVYTKKYLAGVPPLSLATGQQIGATIILLPVTLVFWKESFQAVTPIAVFSMVGLALFCTTFAYLLYFYLIESAGPTIAASVTLLIPFFGIVWGLVFLNETITWGMIVGLFIILSSIFLISDQTLPKFRKQPS